MGFLSEFFNKRSEKRKKRDNACIELKNGYSEISKKTDRFLKDYQFFIDPEETADLAKHIGELDRRATEDRSLKRSHNYMEMAAQADISRQKLSELQKTVITHNRNVIDNLLSKHSKLLNAEGKEFDRQQKECIVKSAHNHLVLSGAGTGKTMTIIGKVKYLLMVEGCDPERILVLSFTNNTAEELKRRIKKETGKEVNVSTFHKLGLEIIKKSRKEHVKIREGKQFDFIIGRLNSLSKDNAYYSKLLVYASEVEEKKYWAEKKLNNKRTEPANVIITKRGEKVRSHGEKDVANFLHANRINYVYESSYKVDEEGTKYHPDFYLPEYEIYIEYYGIDKDGRVPAFFSSRDGKTPSETYAEGMKWKRELHTKKGTKLIEVYAYERLEGILQSVLKDRLAEAGVKFHEKVDIDIDEATVSSIAVIFETLLNKMKSKNLAVNDVRKLIEKNKLNLEENMLALSLFEPIHEGYQSLLKERGEIDFNDMINDAAEYVKKRVCPHNYDHVLIDEYQDMSDSRFNLLKEMRKTKDYHLFAVGDDWQSIYGFSGSNLNILYGFDNYWGVGEQSKVETTYRFPEKLISVSGKFIMENPKQIQKVIKADNAEEFWILEIRENNERKAIMAVIDRLMKLPVSSTVFLLGRYENDKNILFTDSRIRVDGETLKIGILGRDDLKISFLTVHSSKGLQADCVVILNNKDDVLGFPSRVAGPAIVSLLDDDFESFPFSEERRVYYVAMTRAKKMLILLTLDDKVSPFTREILEKNSDAIEKNYLKECPMCGGRLVKRSGDYGLFYGCSNYYVSGCKYKEKIENRSS